MKLILTTEEIWLNSDEGYRACLAYIFGAIIEQFVLFIDFIKIVKIPKLLNKNNYYKTVRLYKVICRFAVRYSLL